jgi:hypothetical protein
VAHTQQQLAPIVDAVLLFYTTSTLMVIKRLDSIKVIDFGFEGILGLRRSHATAIGGAQF